MIDDKKIAKINEAIEPDGFFIRALAPSKYEFFVGVEGGSDYSFVLVLKEDDENSLIDTLRSYAMDFIPECYVNNCMIARHAGESWIPSAYVCAMNGEKIQRRLHELAMAVFVAL